MGLAEKVQKMHARGASAQEIAKAIRTHERRKSFAGWFGSGIAIIALAVGPTVASRYYNKRKVVEAVDQQEQAVSITKPPKAPEPKKITYNGIRDSNREWFTCIPTRYNSRPRDFTAGFVGNKFVAMRLDKDPINDGQYILTEYELSILTGRIINTQIYQNVPENHLKWPDPDYMNIKDKGYYSFYRDGGEIRIEDNTDTVFAIKDGKILWKNKSIPSLRAVGIISTKRADMTRLRKPYTTSIKFDNWWFVFDDTLLLFYKDNNYKQKIDAINLVSGEKIWTIINTGQWSSELWNDMQWPYLYGRDIVFEYDRGIIFIDKGTGEKTLEFIMTEKHDNGWRFTGDDADKYYVSGLTGNHGNVCPGPMSLMVVAFKK